PPAGQLQQISARISSIRPREPGIYSFTLEDGAEWLFAEGVPSNYRTPRAGSVEEIERRALGSCLMRFARQTPVPVRRVRWRESIRALRSALDLTVGPLTLELCDAVAAKLVEGGQEPRQLVGGKGREQERA